jgi:hypothetical protein
MKVGQLLLWTCIVIVTAAAIVWGYVLYVEHRVETFKSLLATQTPQELSRALALFSVAPPMKCVEQSSTFNTALTVVAYFHAGKTRLDFIQPSRGINQLHEVMNANDLYIWTDDSDTILHLAAASDPQVPQDENGAAALSHVTACEVWWNPDDSVFTLPGAKTITEG